MPRVRAATPMFEATPETEETYSKRAVLSKIYDGQNAHFDVNLSTVTPPQSDATNPIYRFKNLKIKVSTSENVK